MEREIEGPVSPGGRGTGKMKHSAKGKSSSGEPQRVDAPKKGRSAGHKRGSAGGKTDPSLKKVSDEDKGKGLAGLREDQPGRDRRGDRNAL